MNPVLLLDNVSKRIKNKEIVKGISFSITEGEVLGFLGPNGAGKSTTLRMIVGLSSPTSGKILIDNHDITKDYVNAMSQVGCIIEGPDMYNYLSGLENLKMLGSMNKNVTSDDINKAIQLVGMQNRINDKVSTYSLGMKQRLGLAQALIHKPKLLILDEPTNGLDPSGINEFRNIIKNLSKKENIAVLISSHLISEVELMCDKVAIVKNGTLIKYSKVSELINEQEVFFVLNNNEKGLEFLKNNWNIDGFLKDGRIEAKVDLSKLEEINLSLIKEGLKIKFVNTKHKTLEDLFLSLTEEDTMIN
ncbi:ABC-2 type transport system ATP-binding protein [Clostridium saccharoperbutylacetonicum]|uniref:Putative bacitracin transporter ATP-binding protein n=1 Tax=Clostridium saccharoperbutylacetonicum N1-4(HMT) TaxID=931276 RepID=M1MD17_9CLOT|nr:ABC transporter ATP-binding protein [Clostridium saccharoperbutylacetonicum]AGF54268.1 putative bacitracin transporter ATP-binding protein [Clostridium saccharoperbutylacetonicum N1-4(HMT)]NRT59216.1 ABC-2 type transport system ATP-binding protein [Clostridium saccharoperbutylacetonicum]NSB28405.1 ABC-2 type transport system ATP-binding protein [Clostridium saccharoperbutylacetonicum]NSB41894.1 ABC-2 type transport system ATP-binding protein [Clostridium saccharoperbutylacetonicum]